jgi:hypothetical protein
MRIRAQAQDYQLFLIQTIEIVANRLGSEAWLPFEISSQFLLLHDKSQSLRGLMGIRSPG